MKIQSPNNIEVLLHYHTTPTAHPRIAAPAVAKATKMLLAAGCIEQAPAGRYRTTPRGEAWVDALCDVELPRGVSRIRRLEQQRDAAWKTLKEIRKLFVADESFGATVEVLFEKPLAEAEAEIARLQALLDERPQHENHL